MDIRFLIEYKKEIVQLPVNPAGFKIPRKGNNSTESIVKLGEISLLKDRKLSEFAVESFLPTDSNRSYVVTRGSFKAPQFYIDFFEKILNDTSKQPCLLTVYGLNFSATVSLEEFEYSFEAGDDDVAYKLKFKEYKPYTVKTVTIKPTTTTTPTATVNTTTTRPKTGIAIGDTVTVNGRYWYSSYGDKPFGTFTNFRGKVSHIVASKTRKYRYHITTLSGGYRGWVSESQISNVQ